MAFSEAEKRYMLSLLNNGRDSKTAEELSAVVYEYVECNWQKHHKSTTLGELNRRYGKTAKRFGDLRKVIDCMVYGDLACIYRARKGCTVVIPSHVIASIDEAGGGETALNTVIESYKS